MELNHSSLHHHIMSHIVSRGFAPRIAEMQAVFEVTQEAIVTALQALQEYHGVVLHPNSSEVWVMHPFATTATNFWIQSGSQSWWGNCAWCSLGAAALLDRDLTITTTLGGEGRQITIAIMDGQVMNQNLFVHFPIPMQKAWDNVIYTCSTMLMFDSEAEIDAWCERHHISKGDVQPIEKIWQFSRVWYGNHLDENWQKWTVEEAIAIFQRFELDHPVWDMPSGGERF